MKKEKTSLLLMAILILCMLSGCSKEMNVQESIIEKASIEENVSKVQENYILEQYDGAVLREVTMYVYGNMWKITGFFLE